MARRFIYSIVRLTYDNDSTPLATCIGSFTNRRKAEVRRDQICDYLISEEYGYELIDSTENYIQLLMPDGRTLEFWIAHNELF